MSTTSWRILRWTVLAAFGLVALLLAFILLTWPDVEQLASVPPRTTAFIEMAKERQRERGQPAEVAWQWVPDAAISPHLKRAAVAAEDMEFFSHAGFSTAEIGVAIKEAIAERSAPRGASTITQQLAKNLWLSPSRNPLRKLKEAVLTRQLEQHLTKSRILEIYLNVVEFGPSVYGAEAAAWHYFGKSAVQLTEYEAAMLAASLPRPSQWNPARDTPSYRRYVAEIVGRMERAAFLWRHVGGSPPPNIDLDTIRLPEELLMSLDSLPRDSLPPLNDPLPADSLR